MTHLGMVIRCKDVHVNLDMKIPSPSAACKESKCTEIVMIPFKMNFFMNSNEINAIKC